LERIRLEKGPLWDAEWASKKEFSEKVASSSRPAPRIKDVIGKALPHIGSYKSLDNKLQKIALIDDVSTQTHVDDKW